MKILMCLGGYDKDIIGGAEIQSTILSKELMRIGHEVIYLCTNEGSSQGPVIDTNGMIIYKIKRPYKNFKALHYFNIRKIYTFLEKINPDVIYQRGDYHFMDIISNYGKKKGIPVVSALSMERHCKKPRIYFSPSILLQIINAFLINRYYRSSSLIISQTQHQRELFQKNFGIDSIVIPIGHPIPNHFPKKEKIPTVIWVANLKIIKRPEIFIRMAKMMKDTKIRFIMIGRPDNGAYQKMIDAEIKQAGNVEYLGEKDLDTTNNQIGKAWILINTSESEGFSNTFVQAWLRGTIVISLNSDPDNMISEHGLGAMASDVNDLVKKINYFLNNPKIMNNMFERSREISSQRYNIQKVAKQLEKIFIELDKKNPKSRLI